MSTMRKSLLRTVLVAASIPSLLAFAPVQRNSKYRTEVCARLPKFLSWFRRDSPSETTPILGIGSELPNVEIDQVLAITAQGDLVIAPTSIKQVVGNEMTILVAMPASSSKSCKTIHLPGYKDATSSLIQLGVKRIVILVTSEKFIKQGRSEDAYILTTSDADARIALDQADSTPVTILVDANNTVMEQLGVTKEMGFNVRTNRLVIILEDCLVKQVLREENVKDCTATSAMRLVEFLKPDEPVPEENPEAIEIDFRIILLLGAIVTIASYETIAEFIAEQNYGWNLPFIPIRGEDSPVEEVFQLLKDHL